MSLCDYSDAKVRNLRKNIEYYQSGEFCSETLSSLAHLKGEVSSVCQTARTIIQEAQKKSEICKRRAKEVEDEILATKAQLKTIPRTATMRIQKLDLYGKPACDSYGNPTYTLQTVPINGDEIIALERRLDGLENTAAKISSIQSQLASISQYFSNVCSTLGNYQYLISAADAVVQTAQHNIKYGSFSLLDVIRRASNAARECLSIHIKSDATYHQYVAPIQKGN